MTHNFIPNYYTPSWIRVLWLFVLQFTPLKLFIVDPPPPSKDIKWIFTWLSLFQKKYNANREVARDYIFTQCSEDTTSNLQCHGYMHC